jgi:hypothetical protein
MLTFTFLKKLPLGTFLRVFALTIILLITVFNIQWLPMQIHKLKQGRVEGLGFEYISDSGKVGMDSASLESRGISGEVVVVAADKEAMNLGIFPGSIVLNSEALTTGEIGTPVTLLVKYGDLPIKEISITRRQPISWKPTLSDLLGLPPLARLYFAILFLCTAVILTGMGGIVAFWYKSDAWLAFFVVGAITNFFTPMQATNPSWLLFWSYFPAGLILFLLLFPNGNLNPKWSWMLVFLPLSKNINVNALGRAYLPIWPEYIYNFWSQHKLHLFLVIASILAIRYRKEFTLTERRRVAWLILGLLLISTWRQWLAYLGASVGFIQNLNGVFQWPGGGVAGIFFNSLFGYGVAVSLLLILGVVAYRYRNTFTPVERQQAKWLILFLALSMPPMIVVGMLHTYYVYPGQFNQFVGDQLTKVGNINDKIFLLTLVFLGLCTTSALSRYRLWDVDTFINHALIYGGLLVTAGTICLATAIFIKQTTTLTAPNQIAFLVIPIAIFLIVVTYKPVRAWLQELADHFFPPERVNFPESFIEFTPDLRGYFTSTELSKILAEKSMEQMRVTHASVFLRNKSGKLQHVRTASTIKNAPKPVIEKQNLSKLEEGESITSNPDSDYSIIIPLSVPRGQGSDFVGALMLGPRLSKLGYSTEMKKSLQKFGEEIGTSLYIAQIKGRRQKGTRP